MSRPKPGPEFIRFSGAVIFGLAALALALTALWSSASAIETPARHALLVDDATGTVLFEKDARKPMPPASMSKLMTAYLLFERLALGSLKLDDTLPVSKKAWRMGGSKMFVRVGTRVTVENLVRGIVVQSGNDACIVVAEGLAGSEGAFAAEMNEKAREIGLTASHFVNATGWPHPDHVMSAADLAHLARRIIHDFPQYYVYFKEKNFTYNKIRQGNRNPLLYRKIGADGLKTGHTESSGYGLTASAARGDRRLVLVVNGLESVNQRARESERLLSWGFREFDNYALFKAGDEVDVAEVWLGGSETVPLMASNDIVVTLARKARRAMSVKVVYDGPIAAPISKGAEIAKLVITAPDTAPVEVPLMAGSRVEQLGPFGRLMAALGHLVWGAARK